MNKILETERLYLRQFTMEDAPLVFEMHQDPEVTKFTGDPIPWDSIKRVEQTLEEAIIPQYENNIGRWAVHLKKDDSFIGWCGLKQIQHQTDLGYRFIAKYWGNGYASEAAKAVLDYGIKNKISNIIGRAAIANGASVKVLKKIGLTFDQFYFDENMKMDSVRYIYI